MHPQEGPHPLAANQAPADGAPPLAASNPDGVATVAAPAPTRGWGGWLAGLGLFGLLLLKLKNVLLAGLVFAKPLLLMLKAFGATGISMVLMVWVYATIYGLPFAAGFVGLILLHELGHAYAMKRLGLRASGPVFIPFVGAFIAMRDQPKDVRVEALVGIAGPLAGTGAAVLCFLAYGATASPFFLALAYVGFFFNFFNLLPITPFDGGRVAAAISRKLWWLGLAAIGLLLLYRPSPLLVLMLLFAGLSLWQDRQRSPEEEAQYYAISDEERRWIGGVYFGLTLVLGYASYTTYALLQAARGLG